MTVRERNKIIKLLQSGDFTIQFNGSIDCTLATKHFEEYGEAPNESEEIAELENGNYGGELVKLLVEALGGKLVST